MADKIKLIFSKIRKYNALVGLLVLFVVAGGLSSIVNYNAKLNETAPTISDTKVQEGAKKDESIDLPVIMYHALLKDSKRWNDYVISPDMLEEDLKYITENGYTTILVKDLIDYVENGTPLPEKPILLTFDDGYYNNYLYGFPLFQQYNCKAVISIIGYHSERYSISDEKNANYSHITWDEMKEMIDSGLVEIQNHSYNLHTKDNGRVGAKKVWGESLDSYTKTISDDIMKNQQILEEKLGITPSTFTYPYGAISDASLDIIKELGFKASFSCAQKINKITRDPECLYLINRFLRPAGISSSEFFKKIDVK